MMCLAIVVIVSRIIANSGSGYIVQYRGDVGIGAFQTGNLLDFVYFIIFAIFIAVFHTILSYRTYDIRRQLSLLILTMSLLLLITTTIVGNALLVLR